MSPTAPKAPKPIRSALLAACILAWAGAFVATHLPPDGVPDMNTSDKVLHIFGYGGLTTLLVLAMASFGRPRGARILMVMALLLAYGAFDELTQPMFLRTASFHDWLADAAGTAIAVTFWEVFLAVLSSARQRSYPVRAQIDDK
jgi:VanZ family protein